MKHQLFLKYEFYLDIQSEMKIILVIVLSLFTSFCYSNCNNCTYQSNTLTLQTPEYIIEYKSGNCPNPNSSTPIQRLQLVRFEILGTTINGVDVSMLSPDKLHAIIVDILFKSNPLGISPIPIGDGFWQLEAGGCWSIYTNEFNNYVYQRCPIPDACCIINITVEEDDCGSLIYSRDKFYSLIECPVESGCFEVCTKPDDWDLYNDRFNTIMP